MVHFDILQQPNLSGAGRSGRLVVVSNRVPVPTASGSPPAGGLAVALSAALEATGGVWFGWSGKISEGGDIPLHRQTVGNVEYAVADLSRRDIDEYYHGFANRVLWPVCHYRLDLADLSRRDVNAYFRVNEQFARRLARLLQPDDTIWVQDYHFIPMASYLRDLGFTNRIGFFYHIPWPCSDIAAAIPAYERILRSFASYDLIGFQTPVDADNFRNCMLRARAGIAQNDDVISAYGRVFRVGAFPISIETEAFAQEARVAERNVIVKRTLQSLEGHPLVIGVDRLDYSKGIRERIDAFATFVEKSAAAMKARVTLLQVTPKSRSEVPEYAEMQREVAEHVGQVNGRLGDVDWTPVRYVNKSLSRSALAGLYRIAKVGLVTPLRDGMNLVAKEYVAAQNPDDPGVLVLSRFAGASHEMETALIVNPYNFEETASAIQRAFEMPLRERKERWEAMMATITANDVNNWCAGFLAALGGPTATSARKAPEPLVAAAPAVWDAGDGKSWTPTLGR
jgi:trehalose 6-phosphate synthase